MTVIPGAHELPKVAKEHATWFHHNPNYVTHFQKFLEFFSYDSGNNVTIFSIYGN